MYRTNFLTNSLLLPELVTFFENSIAHLDIVSCGSK